jgi:hypothetical protein
MRADGVPSRWPDRDASGLHNVSMDWRVAAMAAKWPRQNIRQTAEMGTDNS